MNIARPAATSSTPTPLSTRMLLKPSNILVEKSPLPKPSQAMYLTVTAQHFLKLI